MSQSPMRFAAADLDPQVDTGIRTMLNLDEARVGLKLRLARIFRNQYKEPRHKDADER